MRKYVWGIGVSIIIGIASLGLKNAYVAAQAPCPNGEMIVNGECGDGSVQTLNAGWSKIEPAGDTVCAHGTPYAYWVRPGTNDNLMLFFEGGGGCWSADTCRDTGQKFNGFYDSAVTSVDDPSRRNGVLDFDHPDNPFSDYTVVFIPVCTGDVHWGDQITTFTDSDGEEVVINFNGFVNAQSAIQWAYDNVPEPESVFMTGCSAGSPGSLMHAPYVIEHYSDTPVVQFGDSLSLINDGPVDFQSLWGAHDRFAPWIPALANMEPLDWTMARHYIAVANYYPNYTFSQYNTVRDSVQVFYTTPFGDPDPYEWTPLLDAHLDEIAANAPNYRSFTAGGDVHCITPSSSFYSYAIDGVKLVDWVTALINGEPMDSRHCTDCESAEIIR